MYFGLGQIDLAFIKLVFSYFPYEKLNIITAIPIIDNANVGVKLPVTGIGSADADAVTFGVAVAFGVRLAFGWTSSWSCKALRWRCLKRRNFCSLNYKRSVKLLVIPEASSRKELFYDFPGKVGRRTPVPGAVFGTLISSEIGFSDSTVILMTVPSDLYP